MHMITLTDSREQNVTVLSNSFIDNYMPKANGEFVKVSLRRRFLLVWNRWQTVFSVPKRIFSGD